MTRFFVTVLAILASCIFMTALEKPAAAVTHHVTSGQKIQTAIDASANGDEIEVGPGTYYESINFKGKSVRLYSSGGPSQTTIYGFRAYHVVKCVSGEGEGTILEGFTITGGNANGAGLDTSGGGMLNNGSSPTVINCVFGGNTANASGGGMFNYGNASVINCTFIENTAVARGGGMYNYGSPAITNCRFTGNSSDQGGAVYNYGSPSFTNSSFLNNFSTTRGGGMYNYQGSPTVTNCTFSGNSSVSGGGMYIYNASTVTNCILWGNTRDQIYNPYGNVKVTYSDVEGGWAGTANINADPCFVDVNHSNLQLKSHSPCIDAANGAVLPSMPWSAFDLKGKTRYIDINSIPDTGAGPWKYLDMGAYEVQCSSSEGDVNCDFIVNFEDLAILTNNWLKEF